MMLFNKSMPRRTFLKGVGATVALPFRCHDPGLRRYRRK
jgi:hypothetical protein